MALAVYSNDQIANQLAVDYWNVDGNGGAHRFNVRPGGTLTVNLTALTTDGQTLARAALGIWSDISGIRFSEVASGGQIVFDDAKTGASTSAAWSRGFTTVANVNVGTEWIARYGTGLNTYSMQTYVHEIGHALGLGHAGNYDGDADYPDDALYANDAWSTTIMSYFDQRENSYFSAQGFSRDYVVTPMAADALAIASIYGANTTLTRTGDTVYGFGNTSGRSVYDASAFSHVAYMIFDNGGTDTLDYSGYSAAQLINLNPETFSNIGGDISNVTIARGTIIERAIGGSGADTIIGNSAANTLIGGLGADTLTGGGGGDIFQGTRAQLNGDYITDLTAGDRISIIDPTPTTLTYSLNGSSLSIGGSFFYTPGVATINVGGFSGGFSLVTRSDGIDLIATALAPATGFAPHADFTADGRSDILFRNANGAVSTWNVSGDGRQVQQSAFNANVDTSWKIVDTFNWNGDTRSDILWRNADGGVAVWRGEGSGFNQASYYHGPVGNDWRIAGTGDLNGDRRDDLMWQNADGSISAWTSTGTGFAENTYSHGSPGAGWKVEGLGDFTGDGKADILWRNTGGGVAMWSNNGAGTSFNEGAFYQASLSTTWHITGVGDFNGDGRDDILWRNDSGALSVWRSNGSGFDQAVYNTNIPTSWHVDQIGDLNGDGKADLVWRNDNGAVSTWQSNGSGFDQSIYNSSAATSWAIEAHDFVV